MNVLIIITGGTLNKVHDTLTENLVFDETSKEQLPDILRIGRCDHPMLHLLMQKDSLGMSGQDRALILKAVKTAKEDRIVITHGTGTMELTAKYLDGKVGNKTVILTGAMRPHSLGKSDASFNLGGAIIAAQSLDYGVFAVMNGRIFEAQNLNKDTDLGRFD